jgi:signal transduction histidine kinase
MGEEMAVQTKPFNSSQPAPRLVIWTARTLWAIVLALVVAVLVEMLPRNLAQTRNEWPVQQAIPAVTGYLSFADYVRLLVAVEYVAAGVYLAVGLIIFWRRSSDPFAVFASATLIMLSLVFGVSGNMEAWRLSTPLMNNAPWLVSILGAATLAALVLLLFLFPNGRFFPGWMKWVGVPLAIVVGLLILVAILPPAALPALRVVEDWGWQAFMLTLLVSFVSGLAAQIHRIRRESDPARRQQGKWVVWGLSASLLAVILFGILGWLLPDQSLYHAIENLLFPLFTTLIPLSILASILRYRLWDIDLWINRTMIYGALTFAILAVYGLSVGLFSQMFTSSGLGGAALSTFIVIALAPTLHRLARRLGDRLGSAGAAAGQDEQQRAASPGATTLTGATLFWARGLWLAVVGLALAFLIANLPYRLAELSQPCGQVDCYGGRLYPYQALIMTQSGLSLTLYAQLMTLFTLLTAFVGFGLAGLVLWRKFDDWMALLVSQLAALGSLSGFEIGHTVLPGWNALFVALQVAAWLSLTAVLFTFPEGRFRPRWIIGLALPLPIFTLAFPLLVITAQAYPGPLWDTVGEWFWPGGILAFVITLGSGLVIQVMRFFRTRDSAARRQTGWAVFGLAVAALIWVGVAVALNYIRPALGLPWPGGGSYELLMATLHALSAIAISLGFGVAMLGYRLWDVDMVLRRGLVYGGFTVLIALSYILLVGVLSIFFQGSNLWLSVIATGLVAILFQPLRQGLQRAVNRLLYGERDDPATVLSRLGQRLEGAVAADAVLPTLVETIAQALKLPFAAVIVRQEDGAEVVVEHGQRPAEVASFALVYQGEALGRLEVAARAPGESLTSNDHRLLNDISRQAGPAINAMLLTSALQRSRERLVATREEERRRLRRDLHDGLGPQLAALSVQIDATRNLLRRDPDAADQALQKYKSQVQEALTEIRRLVYALRPPALDQLGLVSALREYAAHQMGSAGLQVTVEASDPLPPLPAAVEVAAYRIALEALTNVVRHADARRCWLRLYVEDALYLEIEDDGRGMDPAARHGVGLASMRERAEELGGVCRVELRTGGGTVVWARLPMIGALPAEPR